MSLSTLTPGDNMSLSASRASHLTAAAASGDISVSNVLLTSSRASWITVHAPRHAVARLCSMERPCGGSASAAKAVAAATPHQVQRRLFMDASVGLPLGVNGWSRGLL